MDSPRRSKQSLDLDVTIVSAKHLKNVNWRNGGDLKPYAIFWLDPDRRLATKSDDSGSTRPVWNERFTMPLAGPLHDSVLTLEIFHSKPSETPKPLVGTLRIQLKDLDLAGSRDPTRIRSFQLTRPSGRPQGKIQMKLAVSAQPLPDYHIAPPTSYYYTSAPPLPARDHRGYSPSPYAPPPPAPSPYYGAYTDPYSPYYSGYYSSAPPPLPPRPFFDRAQVFGSGSAGPSAPVDHSSSHYEQKPKSAKMGFGAGLGVGAVAGALGGLALEEGLRSEEEKIAERVETDMSATAGDDYTDYRGFR